MSVPALFLPLLSLLFYQAVSAAPKVPDSPFVALTVYDGNWKVTPAATAGTPAKVDRLVNHCTMGDAFYTCEQVVNGKPVALVVFVADGKPGSYHTRIVLPDGQAAGGSQLTIAGPQWTFLSTDKAGKPSFRVVNVFTGRDRIHSEQFQAAADGSWTKVGEQTTVRAD